MVGRGWVYVPFQLSDLREIKNIWTAILMPRQIHSSLYLCDPNLSIDMTRYYASTRPDSFLIRNAMGSGPGHSCWIWLPFTMSPNTSGTWKWGNKCAYLQGHRQSPWQIHTERGWWYGSSSRVLLCRHKILGSSPSTAKGKRKIYLGMRT
jgi:hypothetical protein